MKLKLFLVRLAFYLNTLKQNRERNSESGFSLLEVIITIVIIGLFVALGAPPLLGALNKSRGSEAITRIYDIGKTQEGYFSDAQNGEFADSFQELQNLGTNEQSALSASSSYTYTMTPVGTGVNEYILITAVPRRPSYPTAAGRVFLQGGAPYTIACKGSPGQTLDVSNVVVQDDCPAPTGD